MATIIVRTAEGNDFHFQNADKIASLFMKNRGISIPYELPIFGWEEYLDSVTIFPDNMFEAKYIFNRLVVCIESYEDNEEVYYVPQRSIIFNPLNDSKSDIDAYQANIRLPQFILKTAKEAHRYLELAYRQAW